MERRLVGVPPLRLAALCGAWIALTHGIAPTPSISMWTAEARAFPHPATGLFIEESPLGPGLAHLVGADANDRLFAALHLVLVVLAGIVVVTAVGRRWGDLGAALAVAALFASPLANVLLTWLGQPDPIVVGLGAVAAVATGWAVLMVAAAGLAVAHTEQAVVIVAILGVIRWAFDDLRRAQAVALAVGVVAGATVVTIFKHHYGIDASRLAYAEDVGVGEFSHNFLTTWHAVLVASFGATWALVLLLARNLDHRRRNVCIGAVAVAFGVAFFTFDTTRVFALVTFPAVLVLIGHSVRTLPKATLERVLALTVVAGALYPHLVVWQGQTYVSSLSRTIDWFAR